MRSLFLISIFLGRTTNPGGDTYLCSHQSPELTMFFGILKLYLKIIQSGFWGDNQEMHFVMKILVYVSAIPLN